MSIYKRKFKGADGKIKRSSLLTAEFTYRGKVHRKSGLPDRETAQFWLSTERLRLSRGAVGYIKPMFKSQVSPLITQFVEHLRARARDEMYCYTTEKRLNRLMGECGWMTLEHVTRGSFESWQKSESLWRGKAINARTKNQYLDTAVEWGKWLASPKIGKLPNNPLSGIDRLPAKHNDEYRRAGTVEELDKLLATCPLDRRTFYTFRVYQAKLRGKTVAGLTWRMVHLDATPPFAKTPAHLNKSRKEEKHTLRYEMAQLLRKLKKDAKPKADDLVFPDAPTLADLKDDLAKAQVQFSDAKGNNRLDFHALRATLVDIGKNAGLSALQVMNLLGHTDIRTTLKYYHKNSVPQESSEVLERLPKIGQLKKAQ